MTFDDASLTKFRVTYVRLKELRGLAVHVGLVMGCEFFWALQDPSCQNYAQERTGFYSSSALCTLKRKKAVLHHHHHGGQTFYLKNSMQKTIKPRIITVKTRASKLGLPIQPEDIVVYRAPKELNAPALAMALARVISLSSDDAAGQQRLSGVKLKLSEGSENVWVETDDVATLSRKKS